VDRGDVPVGAVVHAPDATALAPIRDALAMVRSRLGDAPVHGVAADIVVGDRGGWQPATRLVDGSAMPDLISAAHARWPGEAHVAAALAWKSYAYWTTLPVVIGFAGARRVPAVTASNTLVRVHGSAPFVEVGLAQPDVTMLATDPLAVHGGRLVADDAELLAVLRTTLLDEHLLPIMEQFHDRVRVGRRTLLGSVASAVCYALLRASDVLPGPAEVTASAILDALGLADLVEFGPDGDGRLRVQRRTCCLAFALDAPKICSSCVIPTAS
jgi:ferric iron reductase protein FhuF